MNGPPPRKMLHTSLLPKVLILDLLTLPDLDGKKNARSCVFEIHFRDSCRIAWSKDKTAKGKGKMVNEPKPFVNQNLEILWIGYAPDDENEAVQVWSFNRLSNESYTPSAWERLATESKASPNSTVPWPSERRIALIFVNLPSGSRASIFWLCLLLEGIAKRGMPCFL